MVSSPAKRPAASLTRSNGPSQIEMHCGPAARQAGLGCWSTFVRIVWPNDSSPCTGSHSSTRHPADRMFACNAASGLCPVEMHLQRWA